jgi:beta-barrel assembly-enhancing protease
LSKKKLGLFLVFALCILISSCSRLKDFIPIEVDKAIGEQFDTQMSMYNYKGVVLSKIEHKEIYAYLDNIKSKILAAPTLKHKKAFVWQLKIIENDSILNAFCVSGGYIYVYTGLIKFLDNEAELAGVLAHEIAHADNRHSTAQLASQMGITLVLSLFIGNDVSFLVNIAKQLLDLSFSRADEQQADFCAVQYLSYTDYDARGVGGFFKKLISSKKDTKIPEFLSTHPASENRLEEIDANWKKMSGRKGKLFINEYQKAKIWLK